MIYSEILEMLNLKFPNKFSQIDGADAVLIEPSSWLEIASFLKNDKSLDFNYLMCVSAYDKGDDKSEKNTVDTEHDLYPHFTSTAAGTTGCFGLSKSRYFPSLSSPSRSSASERQKNEMA